MWAKLIALLASLAADPAAIDREMPRSCGAVAVAYAATAQDKAPEPKPVPPKPAPAVCEQCGGKGFIVHGDGHRTPCPNCKGKE
jgi:hypothetical protein